MADAPPRSPPYYSDELHNTGPRVGTVGEKAAEFPKWVVESVGAATSVGSAKELEPQLVRKREAVEVEVGRRAFPGVFWCKISKQSPRGCALAAVLFDDGDCGLFSLHSTRTTARTSEGPPYHVGDAVWILYSSEAGSSGGDREVLAGLSPSNWHKGRVIQVLPAEAAVRVRYRYQNRYWDEDLDHSLVRPRVAPGDPACRVRPGETRPSSGSLRSSPKYASRKRARGVDEPTKAAPMPEKKSRQGSPEARQQSVVGLDDDLGVEVV